jgi:thiamine biosynthesis lipoprotein
MKAAAVPGVRRVEQIMGMPIVLDVRDEDADDAAIEAVFAWLREVDARFSTYREDSAISRLNRGELALEAADRDVREVLARCEELRQRTRGFFDARYDASGAIDPSGLVKGWAVDRGAELLDAARVLNYALNAGGDIRLRGGALPSPSWSVGVEHPLLPQEIAAVLDVSDAAVATSGTYVRGEHVIDPHSRRPPSGVLSVTIVGPELATADAYATAAFAMGEAGPDWTRGLDGYEAMTILSDGRVLSTAGFPTATG